MRANLLNARKALGYTQQEISENLGITNRQYHRLEAGPSDGSIRVWQQLKILLHAKSIDYLLEQVVENHLTK